MTTLRSGQRVKFVGMHGRADGLEGRVSRVLKSGEVKVRWDDGNIYAVHPEDIRPIPVR